MDKSSEILGQNFDEYKKFLLSQNNKIIFDKSYETAIKKEIAGYCDFEDILSDDIIANLLIIDNPLDFLYEEYLRCDTATITNELNVVFKELNL